MFLRFYQILGISSECAYSVLTVCSDCVQSVFRVCSECVQYEVISSTSASSVSIFGIFSYIMITFAEASLIVCFYMSKYIQICALNLKDKMMGSDSKLY